MKSVLHHPLGVAVLTLGLASLACGLGGSDDSSTPIANFPTATPGGSISVSLLTPTQTLGVAGQVGTPIGPVATATAAAQTAVAQTATAAMPTPTIPGIFAAPEICPQPGTPSLPAQPPSFTRYAEVIVEYLSQGGASTVLEANLRSWEAITNYGGLVRADRDFTGDGVPEVLVLALDPQNVDAQPQPGDLFIFGCQDGAYRLLYRAGYAPDRGAPLIVSADDLNGDYLNDMVYAIQNCDALICYTALGAVEWNVTLGNFENLLSKEWVEPNADVVVSDTDDDGLSEITITRGLIADEAAGPQRLVTTILKWDGTLYTVAEVITSPAEYRIHVIVDGDQALLAGDYQAAADFYKEAAENDALLSWKYPNEAYYLKAYARYRLMLAQVMAGKIAAAQAAYDRLIADYRPPTPTPNPDASGDQPPPPAPTSPFSGLTPGIEFANMADLFWQDFALNRDVAHACDLVVGYARANALSYEVLNSFGFTNPHYMADDLCPFANPSP